MLLLTPPFDRMAQDPGYIKGYLPGVRENGCQYTHAALWTVMALGRLGLGDEAMELFHALNPINHMRTPEDVDRYQAEPYVVAADVYNHPMHVGRGGWTWYTGSAGWMYQAAVEGLPGLRRHGPTFSVNPSVPAMWQTYFNRVECRGIALRHHGDQSGAPMPGRARRHPRRNRCRFAGDPAQRRRADARRRDRARRIASRAAHGCVDRPSRET